VKHGDIFERLPMTQRPKSRQGVSVKTRNPAQEFKNVFSKRKLFQYVKRGGIFIRLQMTKRPKSRRGVSGEEKTSSGIQERQEEDACQPSSLQNINKIHNRDQRKERPTDSCRQTGRQAVRQEVRHTVRQTA